MDLTTLIGNLGFPIAVTAYLLVRIEGQLKEIGTIISENTKVIALIVDKLSLEKEVQQKT